MKIAIIGFGNMGKLYSQIISDNIDSNCTLYISNRTYIKMEEFKSLNPQVEITEDYDKAVENAELVFLCITPKSSYEVFQKIKNKISEKALFISFVSDLTIENISKQFNGKIIRLVPTITSYIDYGITLLSKNDKVTDSDISLLSKILGNKIKYSYVKDKDINNYSIISSCGPGIISSILNELILSFSKNKDVDIIKVSEIVNETVIGTCLYSSKYFKNFQQIIAEVATKGGITESGVSVISDRIPMIYDAMIEEMKMKHIIRTEMINNMYSEGK